MDNFDWEMISSPTVTRSSNFVLPSSVWSNCDILTGSGSTVEDSRCSMSEKVDLNPSLLSSILGLHEAAPRATGAVEVAAPPLCSFDSSLDLDLLQYQELAARLLRAADSAPVMKSQVGMTSSREHGIPPNLHASFASTDGPMIGSPASCLTESFVPSAASSEDDLSAIFYRCSANISSRDSEVNHGGSLDQLHHRSGCVEVASKSSSNPKWPPRARRSKGVGVKRPRNSGENGRIADVHRPKSSGKYGDGIHLSFRSALSMSKKARRTWPDQKNSSIDFGWDVDSGYKPDMEAIAQVKEMMYMTAALRPVNLGLEEPMEKPKRKNVNISSDPQTVAARHRRERISERLRVLQKLVPGGNKMDTASMLDEAANYLKFLKSQVRALEKLGKSISNNNRLDMAVNSAAAAAVTTSPFPLPLNHRRQAFPMQHLFHSPKP